MKLREKLQIFVIVVLAVSLTYTIENISQQNTIVKTEYSDKSVLINAEAIEDNNGNSIQAKKYDDTFTRIYNKVKDSVVQI